MEHLWKEISSDILIKSIDEQKGRLAGNPYSNPNLLPTGGSKALDSFETISLFKVKCTYLGLKTQNTLRLKQNIDKNFASR